MKQTVLYPFNVFFVGFTVLRHLIKHNVDHVMSIQMFRIPATGSNLQISKNITAVYSLPKICGNHVGHNRLAETSGSGNANVFVSFPLTLPT